MTDVTFRLTAKNRDQLRNPTLGNRVWATFTFFTVDIGISRAEVRIPTVPAKDFRQRVRGNSTRVDYGGRGVVTAGHVVPQRHQQRAECLRSSANQLRASALRRHGPLTVVLLLVFLFFNKEVRTVGRQLV